MHKQWPCQSVPQLMVAQVLVHYPFKGFVADPSEDGPDARKTPTCERRKHEQQCLQHASCSNCVLWLQMSTVRPRPPLMWRIGRQRPQISQGALQF